MKKPTKFQREIARALGVPLRGDSEGVAAARIRQHVANAIQEKPHDEPATDKQIAYATSLGIRVDNDTKGIAAAKIEDHLQELNVRALERLSLKPGDRVRHTRKIQIDGRYHELVRDHVVSSIASYGRIFFKGIGCQSGWPTQIELLTEPQDATGDSNKPSI